MRGPLFTALFTLLVYGCGSTASEHSEATPILRKPSIPLILTIEPRDELTDGSIVDFEITAIPGIDVADLQLSVDVPDSLAVYSGDRDWRGGVSAGQKHSLVLALRIPSEGSHRIVATAVMHLSEHQVLATREVYVLGGEAERPTGPTSRVLPGGDGNVKEYVLP